MSSIKVYVDGKPFGEFKEVSISSQTIVHPCELISKHLPSEDVVVELNCRVDKPKAPEPIRCCRNCKHFQYLKGGEGYILPFCVDSKCIKKIECLQDKNIDSFERGCFVERGRRKVILDEISEEECVQLHSEFKKRFEPKGDKK